MSKCPTVARGGWAPLELIDALDFKQIVRDCLNNFVEVNIGLCSWTSWEVTASLLFDFLQIFMKLKI